MMNLLPILFLNTFLDYTENKKKNECINKFPKYAKLGNQCAYFTIPMSSFFPYVLSKLLAYIQHRRQKFYHITTNVIYRITV